MDVEKLLGKLLHEVTGSGNSTFKKYAKGSKKKKKKYKKKYGGQSSFHKKTSIKDSLIGNLTSQLTSGKGLLTAVGLGVGAYEIYRTRTSRTQQAAGVTTYQQPVPVASSPTVPSSMTPPPPPPSGGRQFAQQQSSAPPASAQTSAPILTGENEEVARRLIRVMVGAAHADGVLDAEEEKIILDRLRSVDFDQEEKMFLLEELHHPRPISELTQGINDSRLGQAMYAVAVSTIALDTDSERQWLDELGSALGLSQDLCQFIEENR